MDQTEYSKLNKTETAPANLRWRWGAASDVGRVRKENEDAFVIEPDLGLFLISDGMGGHLGGALASKMVADDLPPMIEVGLDKLKGLSPRAVRTFLGKTIGRQNRQLRMEGISESGYKGMGATVAMVLLKSKRAYIANVGDSRIYRFRNNRIAQINRDHSVVAELLEAGRIEPEEAENHHAQGQITQYMGMDERAEPYVRSFALKKEDRLLLCSDGLTDMLPNRRIAQILRSKSEPQAACEALIESANAAGGHDNVTVVVVDWLDK